MIRFDGYVSRYKYLSEIETAALYRLSAASEPLTGNDLYALICRRASVQVRESGLYQTLRRLRERGYVTESQKPKRARIKVELVTAYVISKLGREVLDRSRQVHLEQSDDLTIRRKRKKP